MAGGASEIPGSSSVTGKRSPQRGQTADDVFGTPSGGIPTDGIRPTDPLDGFRDLLDPPDTGTGSGADDIWAGSSASDRKASPLAGRNPTAAPMRSARSRSSGTPWLLFVIVGSALAASVLLIVST